MAEDRFSGGTVSAISECAAGVHPASPTPTPIRARASCAKLWAKPQIAVIADQIARQIEISQTRYAEHGIKHGESRASEQTELCITQPKLALDRFGQNVHNLAIQKVQNVHDQEREQHYLGIGYSQSTAAHGRSITHSVSPSPMRSYSSIFGIVKHQRHNDFDN
jgi:hypothetical protein